MKRTKQIIALAVLAAFMNANVYAQSVDACGEEQTVMKTVFQEKVAQIQQESKKQQDVQNKATTALDCLAALREWKITDIAGVFASLGGISSAITAAIVPTVMNVLQSTINNKVCKSLDNLNSNINGVLKDNVGFTIPGLSVGDTVIVGSTTVTPTVSTGNGTQNPAVTNPTVSVPSTATPPVSSGSSTGTGSSTGNAGSAVSNVLRGLFGG